MTRLFVLFILAICIVCPSLIQEGPSWPWSHGSWIDNYLSNQCLSPLMLWVRTSIRARCTTLCDKVCQWLATGRWFSPYPSVSSTNKTDRYDIIEILLKVALKTIKQTNKRTNKQTINSRLLISPLTSSNVFQLVFIAISPSNRITKIPKFQRI